MEENMNLVDETENTDGQAVEETVEAPKLYTEEEFNAKLDEVLARKIARTKDKERRKYEEKLSKYEELAQVMQSGLGTEDIKGATETMRNFYKEKGVDIPEYHRSYSDDDTKILAEHEANEIISAGMDEVIEVTDELTSKGFDNMTAREKAMFVKLANYRESNEKAVELQKLGVSEEVYNSDEFKDFSKKFDKKTSIADIYNIYNATKPKKDIKPMGSMTTNTAQDSGVKEFYTRDEALKFTKADFDKNPELFKAVENSMRKW